jgi:hypothetical protein
MGLDVYVGTLTRYYSGEWETIIQQTAHEAGYTVKIVRPDGMDDAQDSVTDPTEIEETVKDWRDLLNLDLEPHLNAPLDWSEGMTPPYFTDKPAWDCYSALMIWAAHEEQRDSDLPAVAPDDWTTDIAYQRSLAEGFTSRYAQLLYGPEIWLPGDFNFTFGATDLGGNEVSIGSVDVLLSQLRDLNSRTWNMDDTAINKILQLGAEFGAPLETSARFACAVFLKLAEAAVKHQLPMKLDY